MDQKKTLWIIAAVGAFLLVVLGAAGIIYYSPSKKDVSAKVATSAPATSQTNNTNSNSNGGWINSPSTNTTPAPVATSDNSTQTHKVNEMIVVSDNTTVYGLQPQNQTSTTIDLNALKADLQSDNAANTNKTTGDTSSTVTRTDEDHEANDEDVPDMVPIRLPTSEQNKGAVASSKPVSSSPVTRVNSSKQSSATKSSSAPAKAKTSSQKSKAAPAASGAKKVNQFWVQVASYGSKKAAENARSILDSNKINSDIFTHKDNKDKLYFRVRVGPYMTKSEAEYWQARILKIPYFANNDSYITMTTTTK